MSKLAEEIIWDKNEVLWIGDQKPCSWMGGWMNGWVGGSKSHLNLRIVYSNKKAKALENVACGQTIGKKKNKKI